MTFLKRYSFSAVGLNYLASCLVMLEFIAIGGYVQQVLFSESPADPDLTGGLEAKQTKVQVSLPLLIDAAFCAGACVLGGGGTEVSLRHVSQRDQRDHL